ncbi:MAG: hypothetical protein AAFQ79_10035 [Pseudomonadota bacterium]
MSRLFPIVAALALAACGDPPDLDAAFGPERATGDWPQIEPLGDLIARTDASGHGADDADANAALTARAEALRRQGRS